MPTASEIRKMFLRQRSVKARIMSVCSNMDEAIDFAKYCKRAEEEGIKDNFYMLLERMQPEEFYEV